jgi:hypothetical protein
MNSIGITRSATVIRSTTGHIFVIGGHRTVKNYYYFETSNCARINEPKLVAELFENIIKYIILESGMFGHGKNRMKNA